MKEKKNTSFWQSFTGMFKRLFSTKSRRIDTNDLILSPKQQIARNFFENKLGVVGLIGIIVIFAIVFGTTSFGNYDPYLHETALINIGPGRNFLKVNGNFKDPVKIETGNSFSLGLDEEGKIYFWGKEPSAKRSIADIVTLTEKKKVVDIAAGDRHVLALTSDGELFAAGENTHKEAEIPSSLKMDLVGTKVKKIGAGQQFSVVLTQKGRIIVWGSTLPNNLDIIPSRYQGRIMDFEVTPYNLVLILDDATVAVVGVKGTEINTSLPEVLTNGSVEVVQVAATDSGVIALSKSGEVYAWGNLPGQPTSLISASNIVQVEATFSTMMALDGDGKIQTWGTGKYGLAEVPSSVQNQKVKSIFADQFAVYTVDDNNSISSWGLKGFLFGSDEIGRDIAQRLMYGGRVSLTVGAVAVVISLVIGVIVGLFAGFYGGWLDNLLMRIAEVISSFPFLPLAITLQSLLPGSTSQSVRLAMIMVILGVLSWPGIARLVRGQILAEREKDFILAARALGLKEITIIIKHILPSVFSMIIVNATLSYASSLLTEAGLSYLGFGVKAPSPSWGNMLNGVVNSIVIEQFWWRWLLPALAVLLSALSVNLVGDALRDAMDPRSNQQ